MIDAAGCERRTKTGTGAGPIPWQRGHVYLTAIIDWHTRAVLA